MDSNLLQYFITRTDQRFNELDEKVDKILQFKWQIIGGSLVASFVLTALFNLAFLFFGIHK